MRYRRPTAHIRGDPIREALDILFDEARQGLIDRELLHAVSRGGDLQTDVEPETL